MHLDGLKESFSPFRGFGADTTFVLFFLGLEAGRSLESITFDAVLLLMTMLMVMVLPYFLPSENEQPEFARWVAGRGLIAILAISLGALLNSAYGSLLPESFRFLPLSLLILAAMASCFIQFYGLMRLRPAK